MLSLAVLTVASFAIAAGARADTTTPVAAPEAAELPGGVSDGWWHRVQRGLAAAEYNASENESGLQAPNRAHNLRTYFAPSGVRLHDRTAVGGPSLVGLSLAGIGRGAALVPVGEGVVTHAGARVEIRRPALADGGVVEWYENTPQGLEQGFTLAARTAGEGPLVLELAVDGAQARLAGPAIELLTDAGRRLRYGKLFAVDANGVTLASHLETPSPDRLRLVVDDAGATYPVVIDPLLTAAPDTILESNQTEGTSIKPPAFGGSVAGAGDVNGDGYADVVVGAWGWDGGENEEGAAFVFLGSANGLVGTDPSTAHAQIESNQAGARLGWSVAGAGDVNGDGFGDIVVGAYLYRSLMFFEGWGDLRVDGLALVFNGGPSGITGTDPLTADAAITSRSLQSFLGFSVAGAGDVNNDGFDDIIVSVPIEGIPFIPAGIPPNDRQSKGGAILLFLGSNIAGITGTGFDDADAVLKPYPEGFPELTAGGIGSTISGAGDVNGDGFADVIVTLSDTAVVFLGNATGLEGTHPGDAHAVVTLDVVTSMTSVAGAGDVNGDGFDDIIMGARFYPIQNSTTQEGAAFVVLSDGTTGIPTTSTAQAHASFFGNILAEWLGSDVAGVGDIDNDGFDDIAIAARIFPGSLDSEGVAHIFRGGPTGIAATSLSEADVRLSSGQSSASIYLRDYAISVAGAGNVNGSSANPNDDPFDDVIFGTGYYDFGDLNEGVAFVYHGGPAPAVPNVAPVPNAGADQIVFDIDRDGFAAFTVDGSASVDPDGTIVSYEWREGETLLGVGPVLTTSLSATGDHTVALVVTDDAGISRGDPVTVRVDIIDTARAAFDDFSSGGFSGGIDAWAGPWAATGVTVNDLDLPFSRPNHARLGPNATLSRGVTLPVGATGMTFGFWGKAAQFAAAGEVSVSLSIDGGPFTIVETITSTASNTGYQHYSTTSSWYPATATSAAIRFESNGAIGTFFIDDVLLTAAITPAEALPPLPGALPIANAGVDITADAIGEDGSVAVPLDGSASTDPDGNIASFDWYEMTPSGTVFLGAGATLSVPFTVGTHTAQLIVVDNQGRAANDTVLITINATFPDNMPPVANAGPDQTIIDDGDTLEVVTFDGTASFDPDGTIIAYNWTKNGNIYNNRATFSLTEDLGTHVVTLTVTDDLGATASDEVVVTIVAGGTPPPGNVAPTANAGPDQTVNDADGDGIASVVLDGTASSDPEGPIADYEWWEGTTLLGTSLIQGVPLSVGVHTITLIVFDSDLVSSSDTVVVTVTALVPPGLPTVDSVGASPATITAGASATLSWTTTDATDVSIDNGVGTVAVDGNATVSPPATTAYTVTATGAGGTTTSTVTVTVTVTVTPASNETLTITNFEYRADKNEWRIAGTSSIPGPGNTMTLYTGPTAPGAVTLGTASVDNLGAWEFRERDSAVPPDPTGTISIVSSQGGTWEGISGNGLADPSGDPPPPPPPPPPTPPVAAFTVATTDLVATFADVSTDSDGSVVAWSWVFGDGGTSSVQNPLHIYATAGTYTVSLTVTDNDSGSNTTAQTVTVIAPNVDPVAALSLATADLTATFTDGSTDSDGTIVAWSWNFGDGGASTARNPAHTYAVAATYAVSLTVTDDRGGSNTATQPVTVTAAPNVDPVASFTVATIDLAASFTDGSTDSDGTVVAWLWDYGDGAGSTVANPAHTYAAAAIYTVSLTVTDDRGGSNTTTQPVTVTAAAPNLDPVASFTVATTDLAATFTDGSTDSDGTVVAWSWTFGDGGASSAQNPGHTYTGAATYTVSLTVTDDRGGSSTTTLPVSVTAPPNVDPVAAFTSATTGLAASFSDGSTDSDGTVVTWSWAFGDGGTSTVQNPAHSYADAGTYSVSLTVTDDAGGTATATAPVAVTAATPPQGTVTISGQLSADRGDDVSFTVTVTNTGGATLIGAQLSLTVAPGDRVKDLSPGGTVIVGDVAPGASVSQTWSGRTDKEGAATVTGAASAGGVSLDSVAQSLTVVK